LGEIETKEKASRQRKSPKLQYLLSWKLEWEGGPKGADGVTADNINKYSICEVRVELSLIENNYSIQN
jgi:hypothetical protein